MNDNNQQQSQENLILKKRLNTFRNDKGAIRKVPNDLIVDIIRSWEQWPGTAKSFYQSIGLKKQQLAIMIKKGKQLLKDGTEKLGPFIPVEIKAPPSCQQAPIVLNWDKKKSIRFYQVDHLVDFLKKAA